MPEIKFDAIACKPKPRPTPSAPPNTARAVRLIPITCSSNRKMIRKMATSSNLAATSLVRKSSFSWRRIISLPVLFDTLPSQNSSEPNKVTRRTPYMETSILPIVTERDSRISISGASNPTRCRNSNGKPTQRNTNLRKSSLT